MADAQRTMPHVLPARGVVLCGVAWCGGLQRDDWPRHRREECGGKSSAAAESGKCSATGQQAAGASTSSATSSPGTAPGRGGASAVPGVSAAPLTGSVVVPIQDPVNTMVCGLCAELCRAGHVPHAYDACTPVEWLAGLITLHVGHELGGLSRSCGVATPGYADCSKQQFHRPISPYAHRTRQAGICAGRALGLHGAHFRSAFIHAPTRTA